MDGWFRLLDPVNSCFILVYIAVLDGSTPC
jgi:hypothetical protein